MDYLSRNPGSFKFLEPSGTVLGCTGISLPLTFSKDLLPIFKRIVYRVQAVNYIIRDDKVILKYKITEASINFVNVNTRDLASLGR